MKRKTLSFILCFILNFPFFYLINYPKELRSQEPWQKNLPFTSEMYCDQNASLVLQNSGCGDCATSMLLKYYGFDVSGEDVANDIGVYVSLDLCPFYISGTEYCANVKNEINIKSNWQLNAITSAGGGTLDLLKQEIAMNRPVIIIVDAGLLWNVEKMRGQGHYVLITGIGTDDSIIYQDPSQGQNHTVSWDFLNNAWANSYPSAIDHSYLIVRENGIIPPEGEAITPEKPKKIGVVRNLDLPFNDPNNEDLTPLLSALDYEYELIPSPSVPNEELINWETFTNYWPDNYDVIYLPQNEISLYYLRAIYINSLRNGGMSFVQYVRTKGTVVASGSQTIRILNSPLGIPNVLGNVQSQGSAYLGDTVDLKIIDSGFRDFVDENHQTDTLTLNNPFGSGTTQLVRYDSLTLYDYLDYQFQDGIGQEKEVPILFAQKYGTGELVMSMFPLSTQSSEEFLAYLTTMAVSAELRNFVWNSMTFSSVPTTYYTAVTDVGSQTGIFRQIINEMKKKLTFIFAWWGSSIEVSIYRPDGSLYQTVRSDNPPLSVIVHEAEAGEWSYQIKVLEADQTENYPVSVLVTEDDFPPQPQAKLNCVADQYQTDNQGTIIVKVPRPLYLKCQIEDEAGNFLETPDLKAKILPSNYEFVLQSDNNSFLARRHELKEDFYSLIVNTREKYQQRYQITKGQPFQIQFLDGLKLLGEKTVLLN